jgi:hypothetical protein
MVENEKRLNSNEKPLFTDQKIKSKEELLFPDR